MRALLLLPKGVLFTPLRTVRLSKCQVKALRPSSAKRIQFANFIPKCNTNTQTNLNTETAAAKGKGSATTTPEAMTTIAQQE